jgi:O-antigen/teichoic acid export membrane protein
MYAKAGRTDLDVARVMHRQVAIGLVQVCLPLAAIFVVSGRDIVTIFLGPRWAAAAPILTLLGPYFLFRVLDENLLAFLLGTLQNRTRMVGWIVVAAVSLILIPVGIWVAGPQGAAIAIALSLMIGWLWQQTAVDRPGLLVIAAASLRPAIALLVAVGAGFVLASMPISVFARLLAEVAAVAGIYTAALVLIDRNALRELLKFGSTWQIEHLTPGLGVAAESPGGPPQANKFGDAP